MKMTLTKTEVLEFDTKVERKRIAKAFNDDKETQTKLNELMDLVEKQDWKTAVKTLKGKWWKGSDKNMECSRYEFIGLLGGDRPWMSYLDLIANCYQHPNNYKVE